MFKLKKPCQACPFLKETPTPLHEDRLPSIVEDLEQGKVFVCHKTIDYDGQLDEEGELQGFTEKNQFCAGALIFMEKQEMYPQQIRIAHRLGLYKPGELKDTELVISELSKRKTI